LGALYRCTPKGLAKIGEVGKYLDCHTENFPAPAGMADPPFEAGFALWGAGVAASRKWSRARSGFRAQRGAEFAAHQCAVRAPINYLAGTIKRAAGAWCMYHTVTPAMDKP